MDQVLFWFALPPRLKKAPLLSPVPGERGPLDPWTRTTLEYLARLGGIDPRRVALQGCSTALDA
jgi:hypothetical protein